MKNLQRCIFSSPGLFLVWLLAIVTLTGCGSEDDGEAAATQSIKFNNATDLVQESAADYDDNRYGLITGETLEHWLDDWSGNRPAGIEGDLIILQVADGYREDIKYVTPNESQGIYVYSVPSSRWVMTRSNGVTETVSMVLDGPRMDGLLSFYAINPAQDMIVFVSGTGGNFQNMLMGRGWYLFRYWGTEARHLAILNGSIAHELPASRLSDTASTPPGTGTATVKDLPTDNTALQVTLGEMINAAKTQDPDIFIWDSRSPAEYNGELRKTRGATGTSCGDVDGDGVADADYDGSGTIDASDKQCYSAFEGHPRGAVNLNFTELLIKDDGTEDFDGDGNPDASYRYKSKSDLQDLVASIGYDDAQTIYTYCRTTYRAMITGVVTAVILGYPVRFYDGAMIEWLQLANWPNTTGNNNLPETSPWRTDLVSVANYNESAVVEPPTIIDPYAPTSDLVIQEDKAYKAGPGSAAPVVSDGGNSGGGGTPSLPSNPCGGI